ncbi:MAG: GH92 family glycosyl hydrolase, partial [Clostridia bacterium]|nr:GH92 family glycosyl hydrolase [Clostridia bacterium]
RDPKSWKFYGSMDGEEWVLLDIQENQSFAKFFQTNRYEIDNTTAYLYYKLFDISHVSIDNVGLNITHMSEFRVLNVPESEEDGETAAPVISVNTTTIKGSTVSNSYEGLENLFDGELSTKLCSTYSGSLWVAVQLNAPAVVNTYKMGSGCDAPARDPKNWNVYGSVDGERWVLLDARTDADLPDRSTYYSFDFENTTAYSWYKLELTANNGTDDWGYDLFQLSEWEMGYKAPDEAPVIEPVKQTVDTSSVKGSTTLDGGQGILQIFDGSLETKVCQVNTPTLWVSVKLSAPAAVNTYKIGSANDHDVRDPKDWTVYGSNDGETWVALDQRTDADLPERNTLYTFTFKNNTEYLYYKLDITANNGSDAWGNQINQFSEWQLFVDESLVFEEESTEPVKAEVDTSTVTGSADLGGGESKANLFDGKTSTKMVCSGSTFTVSFALTSAQVVKGYSITSANDHLNRSPKKWNFYGSLDGKEWTKIDSQSSVEFADYFEEQIFGIANNTAYLYYKLEVTENGGNAYTQFSELTLYTALDESLIPEEIPGMVTEQGFGPIATECNSPGAWSGFKCLAVYGEQTATDKTYAKNVIFKDLSIPVTANTRLSYVIFPGLFNIHSYDYEYTSCRVVIDLKFTDGTYLSDLGAKDQYGSLMTPAGQVEGECLYTAQWNYVESVIGDVAAGKIIEKICVYFDMEDAVDASRFITFFDDLKIEDKAEVVNDHLSDYINILRGTNNDIAFSRGMCTPGVTLPGGFNFFTPVNNADSATLPYTYQQTRSGNPLDSISVIHAPNFWIGSYGSLQFMANTSVDTSAGTDGIVSTQISSQNREAAYSHKNEKATAHLYSVLLEEGSAASGVLIEVTPTLHGAYVRFTFPEGSDNVNVIFDSLWGSGTLSFLEDGKTFKAMTTHGSPKMYVYGQFDNAWADASTVTGSKGIVSFEEGTTVVSMKLATSFISYDQAAHNLALEISESDTFDTILAAAQKEWDDLCGKFEIEGASYHELVSFYSSLYRMYAFPSLFSENEGSNEEPKWVYGSPYKNGKKTEGILYTNNGFWDTYRTAWPGYTLFTADRAGQYLDGIAQHYTETGWIPRWMGPGAVNCMVGTSSDVIFADAYIKGVEFDYEAAWESMLRNASAYSSNMTAGGRKENNTAPYKGYIANDNPVTGAFVQEAFSSSIEGFINDYGIYKMAETMGLEDEAEYYLNRCKNYALLFNEKAGFFMGKSSAGVWSSTNFDPAQWNGDKYDFTESVGWVNAFPAVFDGQGMTNLYGGEEALTAKLDALFDDSYEAMKDVVELSSVHHEISEFKEVKMGQYMHNNQPAHHVIYTYAFSSTPYKVQEYVREVLRHVYVGSEIGQGYPGDEDNGEMS